jgi:hypothetical protein
MFSGGLGRNQVVSLRERSFTHGYLIARFLVVRGATGDDGGAETSH